MLYFRHFKMITDVIWDYNQREIHLVEIMENSKLKDFENFLNEVKLIVV